MIKPTYEQAKQFENDYTYVPVCKEILADDITPILMLRKLAALDQQYFLLESVEGGNLGRYSFLGYNPKLSVSCKDGVLKVKENGMVRIVPGKPKEALESILKQYRSPQIEGLPTFTGGLVGYFSYEMIQYAEPKLKIKQSDINDMELMMFDKLIAFDQVMHKLCIIVNAKTADKKAGYDKAVEEIEAFIETLRITDPVPIEQPVKVPEFVCNLSKEEYCGMVEKTKHYIKEGDIFQGVISRRFEADYDGSLLNAYRVLRTTNPSPYMYYMQIKDMQIAGTSPETMVKLTNGKLMTFPVAGTRKRGKDKEEDMALEKELLADKKECAEHNMLVDLARNDLGRISEYGSVKVEDYMAIHRFSKVMHIASTVTGTIAKDKTCGDTIEALLPAGTLSGAPKFRACEIIDELEPVPRGVYGGAIGYLDFSGNLDVCIAIRTAVKKGKKVYVQAGAGVVADSIPENEYQECANKAGAVIEAIKLAEEMV
ncbi:MAG: anthranilate synthase component I [Lachnospiraceae bacterium]|nr:anthranilate synthase component I [Lachnospiraceae bacterium]MBQ2407515.1 anthranilate synthase component I [Lachnospiraceae bacterium]